MTGHRFCVSLPRRYPRKVPKVLVIRSLISDARKVSSYESRWHEEIEIKYILKGKVNIMVETDVFTASEGDIVFINPYEAHSNVPTEDDGAYSLFMIGLDYFNTVGISNINLRWLMIDTQLRIKRHIKNLGEALPGPYPALAVCIQL